MLSRTLLESMVGTRIRPVLRCARSGHAATAAFMAAVAAIGGCVSPFDGPGPVSDRAWSHAAPAADGADAEPSAALDIPADADAQTYVRLALQRHPSIRAARSRIQRLAHRIPQVTALDDPMLSVAPVGEMAQTAAGEVSVMTTISQRLPLPQKLSTRGRIAGRDVAMAQAELELTRLQVAGDTRRAFWNYYFATRALETTRDSRAMLDQFRQIAEAQYRAGTRSQQDVLRASVELSNLDNELVTLGQRQESAAAMLNQLLDRSVTASLPQPPEVPVQPLDLRLDQFLAQAADHNPALHRLQERVEQFRHQRRLARLNRWPDLTVSATYNAVDDDGLAPMANGDDQWWLGFGVNLPIWVQKYDAAEREALHGALETSAELAAERNRVSFRVRDATLRVEAQQRLLELFKTTIIPQASQTVDSSTSAYRAGTADFLTLVDNWRKLLNFQLMVHQVHAQVEQALADLQQAVGQDLARSSPEATAEPGQGDLTGDSSREEQ